MTRSQHPSLGMRAVPNPDDAPKPEFVARIKDTQRFFDTLLMLGTGVPTYSIYLQLGYVTDESGAYVLAPESKHIFDMADHIDVVDRLVAKDGRLVFVTLEMWFNTLSLRATCHAPEAIGEWTPPAQAEGTFTLMQRERLPLWAE